ncbi:MAG: hypothetical protein ACXWOV_11190, partial [Isosphaeraceae bacterium]
RAHNAFVISRFLISLGCSIVTVVASNASGQLRVVCPEKSRPTPIEGGLNVDSSFNTFLVD